MKPLSTPQPNFSDEPHKAVLAKAIIRMADQLQFSRYELAAIIGFSQATLSRLYEGKRLINPTSKEGELAILLLRIYRSLDTLFGGNEQQSRLWLRSPNKHLNAIPAQFIQTAQGLVMVANYLDAIRGKV